MLPWIHTYISPSGDTLPCCITPVHQSLGNVQQRSIAELWNADAMKALRLNMLADRPSTGCETCYQHEQAGLETHRKNMNERFAHHWDRVESTREDGTVEKLSWPFFDIRFSNICNFKCRSCSPALSSGWNQDYFALNGVMPPEDIRPMKDPAALWAQIEPLIPEIEEIYFAGGEPLLMDEHYRILELLVQKKKFDVRIGYNTNFSRFTYKSTNLIELWSQFEHVTVGASLDASHARGEYLRKGQKWAEVVESRKKMIALCPRAEFHIAATVSIFNILHLPDFHQEWVEAKLVGIDDIKLNLTRTFHLDVRILPAAYKKRVRDRYLKHINEFIKPFHPQSTRAVAQFEACLRFMEETPDEETCSAGLFHFVVMTRKLDIIRNENLLEVFPELEEVLSGWTHF